MTELIESIDPKAKLYQEATDAAIKKAEVDGFEVIRREADTLLIDLDETPLDEFRQRLRKRFHFTWHGFEIWESKTSGHHHALVRLRAPLESPLEAVVLQLMLGSDSGRETAAIWDIRQGVSDFSILFRPKGATVVERVGRV